MSQHERNPLGRLVRLIRSLAASWGVAQGKTGWAVCALRLVSRFLFCCPAIYAASAVVTVAPLRQRDSPTGGSVASVTVPLDGLLLPAFRQLAFVDQEGPKSGAAFTLENVHWHSIPS